MFDIKESIKNVEKEMDMTEQQKQKFEPVGMILGGFMSAIWGNANGISNNKIQNYEKQIDNIANK